MSDKLRPGFYVAHVQNWGLAQSKTKGTPQFTLAVVLTNFKGPGGKLEECPSLTRTIYRAITEKTIEYFVNDLKALGYDRDNFDDLDPASPNAFDFEGKEVEVRLKYEQYEGQEQERWELALVKPAAKPLETTGVQSLNAMFGGHLAGLRNGNGSTTPAKVPMPTTEDQIPF
jgi:hypothetical protein